MNSYIETIIGPIYNDLSKNMFAIAIYANVANALDSRNKVFFGRY